MDRQVLLQLLDQLQYSEAHPPSEKPQVFSVKSHPHPSWLYPPKTNLKRLQPHLKWRPRRKVSPSKLWPRPVQPRRNKRRPRSQEPPLFGAHLLAKANPHPLRLKPKQQLRPSEPEVGARPVDHEPVGVDQLRVVLVEVAVPPKHL